MTQSNIVEILESNKENWFTIKQISEMVYSNLKTTKLNMNKLMKDGKINMICMNHTFYYNYAPEFSAIKLRNEIRKLEKNPDNISEIVLINAIENLTYIQKLKYLIKEATNES